MTAAETRAFNAGVNSLLDIAATSAAKITASGQRPIAESFAVAALAELAQAGRALLLHIDAGAQSSTAALSV